MKSVLQTLIVNANYFRLPSLSVTPISTVNETPLVPATFAELESISSDNDSKSELPKPDPNEEPDELSETDTEILTKLLMEQFNGLENDLNAAEIANERYSLLLFELIFTDFLKLRSYY